jgi:ABC-type uncharacterized transport system permease subunit
MVAICFKSAIALYFLATLHYLLYLLLPKKQRVARVAVIITVAGFVCHTLTWIIKSVNIGYLSLTGSNDVLSFLAWMIVLVFLVLEWHYKSQVFGSFVLPLAFLASLYASLLPKQIEPIISHARGIWLTMHILLAIIGFASFSLACCIGIMYLLQEHQLKSHKPGYLFYRLPSLDTMDRLSYRCISVGFPVMTISVILGFAIASTRSSIFSLKAIEIWWLLIWVLYAVLLQARFTIGWRGRKASYLAIIVFVLALLPLLR